MSLEQPISRENAPERFEKRGKEVRIVLKFQRHGLREGTVLTDEGRQITRDLAEKSGWHVVGEDQNAHEEGAFNAAKSIGSAADTPEKTAENPHPLSRALETANITARTVAGERAGTWHPRPEARLNYKSVQTPAPYDHLPMYNAALEQAMRDLGSGKTKLADLTKEEKVKVTEQAQTEVVRHVSSLNTPEADVWKAEAAGMFADLIEHYTDMTRHLDNNAKVLYVAGTHGGTVEWLLQKALVWTDEHGNVKTGYESPDEIGGAFQSSDAYNVNIETNEKGELQEIKVTFDDPKRTQLVRDAHFDLNTLNELAKQYKELHHDS